MKSSEDISLNRFTPDPATVLEVAAGIALMVRTS
jgi:hypothetical protein